MLVYAEGDTPELEKEAQHILFNVLYPAYPGHPWSVRAYKGGFFIQHLDFPTNWGMNCPKHTELYSASAYNKIIVMLAGEWLERANMKRGRYEDGRDHPRVEGVPERYQPNQPLPDHIKLELPDKFDFEKLRTEPRPQAERAAKDDAWQPTT